MSISIYTPKSSDIVHETAVDFITRQQLSLPLHMVQYDNTMPVIAVALYKSGNPFNVSSDMDVNIRVGKPDKTYVYNSILGYSSGNSNVVYFEVTHQMTAVPGKLTPVIEIVKKASVAASASFDLLIDRNPVQQDDVESSDEWKSIEKNVQRVEEYARQASESKTAAAASEQNAEKYARQASESKTSSAASEQNAEKYARQASESKTSAAASEQNAEKYARQASESKTAAAASEQNAEKYARQASTSKTEAAKSQTAAAASEQNAEEYARQASESKAEAAKSQSAAATSEQNAKKSEDILKFHATPVIPSAVTAGGKEQYKWVSYDVKSEYAGGGIKGFKIVNFLNESKVYLKQAAFQNESSFPQYTDFSLSGSYKADGDGVKTVYHSDSRTLEVTLPTYQGIIIYSPDKQLYTRRVSVLCAVQSSKSAYVLDGDMIDGTGQYAVGAHEAAEIEAVFGDSGILGDTFIMRDYGSNTFQSIIAGVGAYPNKPINNSIFSPYELYLYRSGDNARIPPGEVTKKDSVFTSYYGPVDVRYSVNCKSPLVVNRPFYLKGRIFHGCFTLEPNKEMYTQTLPHEDDGYVYIYVGEAMGDYQINLSVYNPIFCYKNGYIRTFNEVDDIIEDKMIVDVSIDETELRTAVGNVLK